MNSTERLITKTIEAAVKNKIDFGIEQNGEVFEIEEQLDNNPKFLHLKIPYPIIKDKNIDIKLKEILKKIKTTL